MSSDIVLAFQHGCKFIRDSDNVLRYVDVGVECMPNFNVDFMNLFDI